MPLFWEWDDVEIYVSLERNIHYLKKAEVTKFNSYEDLQNPHMSPNIIQSPISSHQMIP